MTISFLLIYDRLSRLQALTQAMENCLLDGSTLNAQDLLAIVQDELETLARTVSGLDEECRVLRAIQAAAEAAAETEV